MLLFIQSDTPESHSSWSIFNQSGVYVIYCLFSKIKFSLMWTTKHSILSVRCTDTASDCWELDMVTFVYRVYHMSQSLCVIYVWTFNVWRGNICNVVKVVRHLPVGTEMNCFWPNFKDIWGQLNLLKDLISYW